MRRSARGWVALGCAALAVNGILIVRIVQLLVTVHETSWQLGAQTVRGWFNGDVVALSRVHVCWTKTTDFE